MRILSSPLPGRAYIVALLLVEHHSSASECPVEWPEPDNRIPPRLIGRVSYHAIVHSAQSLYVGEINETWSAWSADSNLIYTHGVLEVEEALKGVFQDTLIVTMVGGQIGNKGLSVSHSTNFLPRLGHRLIYNPVVWDSDRGDYEKGQRVFPWGGPVWLNPDPGLIPHIRSILAGDEVPPVCFGDRDFERPTTITPLSWGGTKQRRIGGRR